MNSKDLHFFKLLKQSISQKFLENNNAPQKIEDWKGEDILLFQDHLFESEKAKISEKWFYTYIKNDAEKLPRIDVLNLLSRYVGFKNWEDFKVNKQPKNKISNKKNSDKFYYLSIPIILTIIVLIVYNSKNNFHFCFFDDDRNNSITHTLLDIKVLQNNESPLYFKTDSAGCFSYRTNEDIIKFTVQSTYYKTDTIIRHINSNKDDIVKLDTDDYALILNYYTNGNTKDWQKRKTELNTLFANDATIYQLYESNIGIEIYSKETFIQLLTTPTQSLKKIKILDKTYKNGKIVKLKFIIQ